MAQKIIDSAKSTIAQNLGVSGGHELAGDKNFSLEQVPDLTGKVAVVTGGKKLLRNAIWLIRIVR